MKTWKKYENELFKLYKKKYSSQTTLEKNKFIVGKYSRAKRQIDIFIQPAANIGYGVIEAKYFNKNLDVKIVDAFIGFLQDVDAKSGILISKQGFTKAAKNRSKQLGLELTVLKFTTINNLSKKINTMDFSIPENSGLVALISGV